MLRNIDPVLTPDLLYALRAMGHGDVIAIVDANFPGESAGPQCIRLDGVSATDALRAILSLMPLDTFVDDPARVMQVVGDPEAVPEIVGEFQAIIDATADTPARITGVERFAFYDRAEAAFAIVQTGERRLYGNILLTKGVVAP
ncbi:MAG: ribose ABC transporter [Rhodobacteraceae bacterium]|nr:MAG: ribose ABC transporter [Paracoccaceae bacterium]